MKLIASLTKPYTDEEHDEFIMDYGQNCHERHSENYEIREVENGLEAWGADEQEIIEREKRIAKQMILRKLNELDLKSIRAIRAGDQEYIAQYEAQAQELRRQLAEL